MWATFSLWKGWYSAYSARGAIQFSVLGYRVQDTGYRRS